MRTKTYLYGVSPVWHLVWLSKCSLRAKLLPQTVQLYGLSVACLFIWRSSEGAFAKTWKQTVQVNMDPPRWHLPWRVKSFAFENALPHTWNRHAFNTDVHFKWTAARIKDSPRYIPDTWMVSSRYGICDVQWADNETGRSFRISRKRGCQPTRAMRSGRALLRHRSTLYRICSIGPVARLACHSVSW